MDGFGDECLTSRYHARGRRAEMLQRNHSMNSLGILYAIVTKHVGYRTVFDEGHVMALAAYGSEARIDDFAELVELLPEGGYELHREFFEFQRYGAPLLAGLS